MKALQDERHAFRIHSREMVHHELDPLRQLFERSALSLVAERKFVIKHGEIERFPEWMRSGPLANIENLCRAHRGNYEIAHGAEEKATSAQPNGFIAAGGQTSAAGSSAAAFLRLGLTVYFGQVDGLVPAGKEFLTALETALGLPPCASLSAFANAPGSGLPFHHDAHDQLLLHLSGHKKFDVAAREAVPFPGISVSPSGPTPRHFETIYERGFAESDEDIAATGVTTHVLEPGSCLFMPAGTWHRTAGQDEPCLSLAISLQAPTRLEIIQGALSYLAGQSADLRAPAYGFFPRAWGNQQDASAPQSERNLAEQEMLAAVHSVSQLVPRLDAHALRRCAFMRRHRDGDARGYLADPGDERYIRLPGSKFRFEESSNGTVRLVVRTAHSIDEGILEFHRDAVPLVEAIAQTRAAFDRRELAARFTDFEEEEVFSFLEQLASVGLLRPLAVPPL